MYCWSIRLIFLEENGENEKLVKRGVRRKQKGGVRRKQKRGVENSPEKGVKENDKIYNKFFSYYI